MRFRLWAPAARQIELCLQEEDADRVIRMPHQDAGWYELVTREAGAGSRYRFRIDGDMRVPDPASRFQPEDVHGPSEVIDPTAFAWSDDDWHGRPWEEAVLYELHAGTFSPQGNLPGHRGAPGLSRRSGDHRRRADAGGGLPRSAQLGLRRRASLRPRQLPTDGRRTSSA